MRVITETMQEEALRAEREELAREREELERLRTDLLTTVSHELRTPLTLVRTSIGLLLEGNLDQAMHDRLLRNIKRSADHMNTLVADILDLARLRRNEVEIHEREIDLALVASEAASLMKPLIDQKQQDLGLLLDDPSPVVLGDPQRIERVFLNLLSNAVKFSPPEARITIAVHGRGDEAIASVRDTGPGISASAQSHLFEQFYTGRTSSSSLDIGAGLGLPIAKGIIEAHGGKLWVESDAGAGSTFFFSLPRYR